MVNRCGRGERPYFADPTADKAIGHVLYEERKKRNARCKAILKDLMAVSMEAKRTGCKRVNFHNIPVENIEAVVAALRAYT